MFLLNTGFVFVILATTLPVAPVFAVCSNRTTKIRVMLIETFALSSMVAGMWFFSTSDTNVKIINTIGTGILYLILIGMCGIFRERGSKENIHVLQLVREIWVELKNMYCFSKRVVATLDNFDDWLP